jgi:hypothetical protein
LDKVIGPGQYMTVFPYEDDFHDISFPVGSRLSFYEIFEPGFFRQ